MTPTERWDDGQWQAIPPSPTANTIVKRRTNRGFCSTTCGDVYIAMPRIPTLDGPYLQ